MSARIVDLADRQAQQAGKLSSTEQAMTTAIQAIAQMQGGCACGL